MKSRRDEQFNKLFAQLPKSVQQQARAAYKLFKENPYNPRLHFKRVSLTNSTYSVRINYSYRALGRLEGDTIRWYWIGSHEAYNKLFPR